MSSTCSSPSIAVAELGDTNWFAKHFAETVRVTFVGHVQSPELGAWRVLQNIPDPCKRDFVPQAITLGFARPSRAKAPGRPAILVKRLGFCFGKPHICCLHQATPTSTSQQQQTPPPFSVSLFQSITLTLNRHAGRLVLLIALVFP